VFPFTNPPTPGDRFFAQGLRQVQPTHPFVSLASDAIRFYLVEARVIAPDETVLEQFEVLRTQAGVFVTLKKGGDLRGCMGTYEPTQANVAFEIIENAISAGFHDPRFPPLVREELGSLCVSVDILKPAELVSGTASLDPVRYGVIVRQGVRRGLLLPGLEEITVIEEQIAIACHKGGIVMHDSFEIYRFEVDRYH
jgi:AmmeMemoRadiSam system protein A